MTDSTKQPRKPLLSSDAYDIIKVITQYWLPAAGTLYFTLAQIWDLPYAEQVVGTITALVLFLGILLGYSKHYYDLSAERYDGNLVVDTSNPEKDTYKFDFKTPLEDIEGKKEITLKIDHPPLPPLSR